MYYSKEDSYFLSEEDLEFYNKIETELYLTEDNYKEIHYLYQNNKIKDITKVKVYNSDTYILNKVKKEDLNYEELIKYILNTNNKSISVIESMSYLLSNINAYILDRDRVLVIYE